MSYEAILSAARSCDATALKAAITTSSIDEFKPGELYFSAGSQLALENNPRSVQFLIDHGANINYIARGAAQGGHREYAESLREKGANIDFIARGAACGNHREYAESLRVNGANINAIAQGAAQGNHREYAELLREEGANIDAIAQGAACGGYQEYAKSLREEGANIDAIACGAGCGGHQEYAESLRKEGANINWIAYGAAQGGHREYAEFLRANGANINNIAYGAAQGGHREYAEFLRTDGGADINDIAQGAAHGGHLYTEKTTFQFLLHFKNNGIRNELITAIKNCGHVPKKIKSHLPVIQKRIENTLHFKNKYALNDAQAITMQTSQQKNHINFLSFWLLQALPQLSRRVVINGCSLPNEILFLISSFIFPLPTNELMDLQFRLTRSFLNSAIDTYLQPAHGINYLNPSSAKPSLPLHSGRAQSFQKAIANVDRNQFKKICNGQVSLFHNNSKMSLPDAVKQGSLNQLESLLAQGADPNYYVAQFANSNQTDLAQKLTKAPAPVKKIQNISPHEMPVAQHDPNDAFYQSLERSISRV